MLKISIEEKFKWIKILWVGMKFFPTEKISFYL